MSTDVELPELGESVVEATIGQWLVKEGDSVEIDQPLVEVTTDKADAELPSPVAGVVEQILVSEGETVAVGTVVAKIGAGAGAGAAKSAPKAPPAAEAKAAPEAKAPPADDGPRATPVAKKMAKEQGVDLGSVEGTGVSGRVTKEDVAKRGAAPAPQPTPAPPAAKRPAAPAAPTELPAYMTYRLQEGDKVVPMSPLRRIVSEHMVLSKRTSPHVGTVAEIDMGAVFALREAHKKGFKAKNGYSLTYLPFIVAATVKALQEFPALNASVVEDAIVERADINIGVAVETEKGLVVPVVRNAERLSLTGLAASIEDLSSRARNKKISPDELRGGSFTISNPGRKGNLYGFAIINQPQVGILRMGEMVKRPVVRESEGSDAIVIRPMMHLALSYDHRAVDGSPANGFLFRIRELLEEADFDL